MPTPLPPPPPPPDQPADATPASEPPPQPTGRGRRRWPVLVIAGVMIAAAAAAGAAAGHRGVSAPAAVTVTVTPSASPSPTPLPAAQADRKTCQAWAATKEKIHAAATTVQVIPEGMTILDAPGNPEWTAAVKTAADLFDQAADTLVVEPGTTQILADTARTEAAALRAEGTAFRTFDDTAGNIIAIKDKARSAMNILCERLAPQ